MKKAYYLFLTAVLGSLSLAAQPQLSDIENFSIGSHSTYVAADPASIHKGTGGANLTWDFSQLITFVDTIKQQIVSPVNTPYAVQFSDADFAEKNSDGTYVFARKSNNGNDVVGFVESGQKLIIKYSDPYRFIERPFAYQDSIKDFFQRSFTFDGALSTGTGTSLTTADAYGTLILPSGTYTNVLRVYFEQIATDTSKNSGIPTTVSSYTYGWFDANHRSALLKIDSIIIENMFYRDTMVTAAYLHNETVGLRPELKSQLDFSAFVKGGELSLTGEFGNGLCDLLLTDVLGRQIAEAKLAANGGILPYNLPALKSGVYIAHLRTTDGRQGSIKFIY